MAEKVNQGIEIVKAGANVLGQFYQDLAQPSVKALGQALATVFELCPNSLLSLKLWTEKRKLNFAKRLNEYKDKLEQIPEEKRCEVDTQIGTPIVEKLTYTTNDEIADLFTTLLANASNIDTVNRAHPAFIDIIGRLSPDEARIINYFSEKSFLCYCDINLHSKIEGYNTLHSHVTVLTNRVQLLYPQNERAYLFNLISLGIISDESPTYKIDQTEYDEIKKIYNVRKLEADLVPTLYKKVESKHSYYEITPLGKLFISACVK
ncbi:DUF4393 domain-containing protein [Phocaeicola sartorii]|uniref:DUF4393 domain-containing protein n=1 Tax=Phocaeicola sartorii TaxID=671267 RepID=UPI001F5AD7CA|nr:DUF4393 domain-containing protein [Phocaeicola sartorii]